MVCIREERWRMRQVCSVMASCHCGCCLPVTEATALKVILHVVQEACIRMCLLVASTLFNGILFHAVRVLADVLQHLGVLVHAVSLLAGVAVVHEMVVRFVGLVCKGQ